MAELHDKKSGLKNKKKCGHESVQYLPLAGDVEVDVDTFGVLHFVCVVMWLCF